MIRNVRLAASGLLVAGVLCLAPVAARADVSVPVITAVSVQNATDIAVAFSNDVADIVSVDVVLFDDSGNVVATDTVDNLATSDVFTNVSAGSGYTVQIVDHTSGEDVVSQLSDPVAIPVVEPTLYSSLIDPTTATVAPNSDGTGWTISFLPPSDVAEKVIYVVTTTDGSSCTVDASVVSQDGTVSCDVPLLDDPSQEPVVVSIDSVLMPIFAHHEPITIDVSQATLVLNGDGTAWIVSFSEPANSYEGAQFVVVTSNGDSCFTTGLGVEGTILSCELPLVGDSVTQPELASISSIQVMYFARGGTNSGGIPTTTTPQTVPIEAYDSIPVERSLGVTHAAPHVPASRGNTWGLVLGLGAMLVLALGSGWARWRRQARFQRLI